MNKPIKIGIVGTGYNSRGLTRLLQHTTHYHYTAVKVLTRRDIKTCTEFPRQDILTHSIEELIDHSDVIVEVCGDALHASNVTQAAFQASLPVVTMNALFQVTCGSYFAERGLLSEAEGDQPGCLAALAENARAMGFKPLVYGNIKGFLSLDPQLEDMQYWSKKQGISLSMVTAATDGTKVQAEQALVANAFDATITQDGLHGYPSDNLEEDALRFIDDVKLQGKAVSDYLLHATEKARVFIVAEHDSEQQSSLEYLKLGEGPYYTLTQPIMLCNLEILKTVKRVLDTGIPLLNNGVNPTASLAAIAKKDLPAGTAIPQGLGSFDIRGIAVNIIDHLDHIPLGLLSNAVLTKPVEKGEILTFDHIDIDTSLALEAWLATKIKAQAT